MFYFQEKFYHEPTELILVHGSIMLYYCRREYSTLGEASDNELRKIIIASSSFKPWDIFQNSHFWTKQKNHT